MFGIYIHIPFCKKACNYCDFHFSTSFKTKESTLKAISEELVIRKNELKGGVNTLYFGAYDEKNGGIEKIRLAFKRNNIFKSVYPASFLIY